MYASARRRGRLGTTVAASIISVLATAVGTVTAVLPASTAQAAVSVTAGPAAGPIDPNTGYPFWYADGTGEKYELCLDRPDTTAGMCLAAPQNPDARPWADQDPTHSNLGADAESFWYNADADIRQNGIRARFIAAQEATFGGGDAAARAGEQIAFGRVRVRLLGMVPGASYTVTQPYGTRTYTADDRGRVFVTQDIGCLDVPCADFNTSNNSALTTYLRWDPAAGPAAPAGYVGDPNVAHEVVGAPSGHNFFRVVGPNAGGQGVNAIETDLFNLQGKLWNAQQPMLGLDSTHNLVDFGKVMVGATTPVPAQTVTLTNAGGGATPLQLQALAVSGADSTQFTLSNDTCSNASLVPGATCTVDVSYAPVATVGAVHAQLDVPSTNGMDAAGGQRILLGGRVSDGTGKDARVTGPIDPVNGFPQWYQDENGTRVALCDDQTDPLCVLPTAPDGTYDPALPMSFPGNFPSELFWWNADGSFDTTNTATNGAVSARLVLGEEAAFVNGDAAQGDQIAFGRIRIRIDGLTLGQTYHVTTPYLVRDFVATDDGKGGGEVNYTEDLGCLQAPCDFNRVNQSNIGPFLRQVGAPKGYLGDPNVSAPITGAPNGFNEFAISGPDVTGQSDLFAVSGKELAGGPVGTGQLSASATTARVTAGQPATITLTNIGTAPATPQVSLPAGSGFTITSNGCATPVAPAATCTVTIGLNGARPGATVDLQVTNGTQPPITITVQRPGGGNAAPTAPALTAASDTGISAVDGLTNLGTVTVSGAAATGQPVQVLVDGAPVTTVNAVAGTFSVPLTLTEGAHTVTAAYADQPSSAPVTVTVDTTAPAVSAPRVSTDVATGPLNGSVVWSGPDAAAFTAQVRRNDGAFTAVTLPGANTTRVQQQLVSGDRYRFRVRGTDAAGNVSAWAGTTVQSSLVQERSAAVRYDGRWARHSVATASGQRVAFSAQRGATATLRTRAQTVKVIAPTGPRRGRVAVLVNGARVRTVDLYSSAPRRRQTVAVLSGLTRPKASVVQVRVLGSKRAASNGTGVALDAFLTNR